MRLIDADLLIEKLIELQKNVDNADECNDYWERIGLTEAINLVRLSPAVEERKHGEWKPIYEDWRKQMDGYECSVCGYKYFGGLYKFCPDCGSFMRGSYMRGEEE